ncbi:hypothetical protein AB0H76_33330 [Nocardia sp. NPDC050712]|uniref:hypothetical protein n=1 Tax=Nocardia sp. NPDC050712 TaxID=3155518 RepID=UPI003411EA30
MTETRISAKTKRRTAIAAAACLAVVAVGAGIATTNLAGADPTSSQTPTPAPVDPTDQQPGPALERPSAAVLEGVLAKVMDPSIPQVQKRGLVEGEADPQLADPNLANRPDAPRFTYRVLEVKAGATDKQVTAITAVSLKGVENPQKADVPFVAEDGVWKIDKKWACAAVAVAGRPSPSC